MALHSVRFDETIKVNDIARTLATLPGVETPSGPVGRALEGIFDRADAAGRSL